MSTSTITAEGGTISLATAPDGSISATSADFAVMVVQQVEGGGAGVTEYATVAELVTASEGSLAPGYYRVETVPPVITQWDGTRFSPLPVPNFSNLDGLSVGGTFTKQTVFSGTQPAAATHYAQRPWLTLLTPTDLADFATILTAMHTHFASNSPYWEVLLVAAGGAGNGFVIAPKNQKFRPFCVVFRRTSATVCEVGIQTLHAGAAITAVGDTTTPPTGTDADFESVPWTSPVGSSGATQIWLVEHHDHFFALTRAPLSSPAYGISIAVGRGWEPFNPLDYDLGRDGLNILEGEPNSGNAAYWFGNSPCASRVHVADGLWQRANSLGSPGVTAFDIDTNTGFVSPWRPPVGFSAGQGSGGATLGTYKYLRSRHAAPSGSGRFTVWSYSASGADDRWLSVSNGTNTNGRIMLPWNKEVEP